ncbi:MAG: 2,3-cyclic 3-phosphodiesterase [Fimbriimonadaceae bacterium]|nr:2,3-cyclic 3-phosphodiesterase [Fimbriimonadaceae bacterium]
MGPLVRCFVGIRIPHSFWPKLQETQMQIRRKTVQDVCRWHSQPELLLTLCALGEQQWDMVKRATTVLGPVCAKYPSLNLQLEGLQGLPNNNQPRFVAVGVTGDVDALKRLREEIARAVGPMLPPTEKEFAPQVMLGRLKVESEQARTALGRSVRMSPPEVLGTWQAGSVEALRTEATSTGVMYHTIESFPLAAPATV